MSSVDNNSVSDASLILKDCSRMYSGNNTNIQNLLVSETNSSTTAHKLQEILYQPKSPVRKGKKEHSKRIPFAITGLEFKQFHLKKIGGKKRTSRGKNENDENNKKLKRQRETLKGEH